MHGIHRKLLWQLGLLSTRHRKTLRQQGLVPQLLNPQAQTNRPSSIPRRGSYGWVQTAAINHGYN